MIRNVLYALWIDLYNCMTGYPLMITIECLHTHMEPFVYSMGVMDLCYVKGKSLFIVL